MSDIIIIMSDPVIKMLIPYNCVESSTADTFK